MFRRSCERAVHIDGMVAVQWSLETILRVLPELLRAVDVDRVVVLLVCDKFTMRIRLTRPVNMQHRSIE